MTALSVAPLCEVLTAIRKGENVMSLLSVVVFAEDAP